MVQLDQVIHSAQEVLLLRSLPWSHSTWPWVLFLSQSLQPSGLPGPLGVMDALEVLVHQADLVCQALRQSPEGPVFQAFLWVRVVLFLLVSRELP